MKICIITKLLPFFMKQLFSLLSDLLHFSRLFFPLHSAEMNYYRTFSFIADNKIVENYCSDIHFHSFDAFKPLSERGKKSFYGNLINLFSLFFCFAFIFLQNKNDHKLSISLFPCTFNSARMD